HGDQVQLPQPQLVQPVRVAAPPLDVDHSLVRGEPTALVEHAWLRVDRDHLGDVTGNRDRDLPGAAAEIQCALGTVELESPYEMGEKLGWIAGPVPGVVGRGRTEQLIRLVAH